MADTRANQSTVSLILSGESDTRVNQSYALVIASETTEVETRCNQAYAIIVARLERNVKITIPVKNTAISVKNYTWPVVAGHYSLTREFIKNLKQERKQ